MIDILTEKTIRILLEHKKPTTSKKIANEIGMSVSSVKHNMDYVRQIIQVSGAILNSVPGKGIWLDAEDFQRMKLEYIINENKDKSYSYTHRKDYILAILFQKKSNYTIQIFADDLGVGRNVIIKDLERIEKWLQYFDLKIVKVRNKGVLLEGDEFGIRQAILYNNTSKLEEIAPIIDRDDDKLDYRIDRKFLNYYLQTYPKTDIYSVQNMLRIVEKSTNFLYNDISFVQLMEYITVSLDRIRQGNVIKEQGVWSSAKITKKEFTAAEQLLEQELKDFQKPLPFEIGSLGMQFVLYGSYDLATSLIKEEYYDEIAREFMNRLQGIIINKKFLINEDLIGDLGLFFQKKKMQQSYQMITGNYFKRDIKEQLPSLYGIVLANMQPVETKLQVKFTENDVAYFVMLLDNALEETMYKINALLITSYDYNTSKYLENKIKKSIHNLHIEDVVSNDKIESIDESYYDLIITTTPTEIKRALKISRRVGKEDFDLITKKMKSIQWNKQKIEVRESEIFIEELILQNFSAKKKEDVLEAGSNLLMKMGYVKKGFKDSLMHREGMTPTSIGNGIAIPHEYRTNVLKSGVAIIKLEHPITWTQEDDVELVFILAMDFETQIEVASFFAKFYELIDNTEVIEEIKNAKKEYEILKIINKMQLV